VSGFGKTMTYLNAACLLFIIHLWLYWKIQVLLWFGSLSSQNQSVTPSQHVLISVWLENRGNTSDWHSERSQFESDLGLAFFTGVSFFYSSNLGNFGRVPDITVRPLRKTSFVIECREIINCVQDVLLVRRIFLKSVGLFGVKFKAVTWLCHCMCLNSFVMVSSKISRCWLQGTWIVRCSSTHVPVSFHCTLTTRDMEK
jgi:hypothetical protein